jgi:ATP-dependent Clp protease adaptor protein ClpS
MSVETEVEALTLDEVLSALSPSHQLILWNDDYNTFEHVIDCLVKHLQYTPSQAEKIAWTVHNEGKCAILEGSINELEIYRKLLKSEGLTVSVE